MSQLEHTLGPWIACKYPDVKTWTVAANQSVASKIRSEADAKLIAAAPDLLVACEKAWLLLDALNGLEVEYKAALEIRAHILPSKLAIVKAKGQL